MGHRTLAAAVADLERTGQLAEIVRRVVGRARDGIGRSGLRGPRGPAFENPRRQDRQRRQEQGAARRSWRAKRVHEAAQGEREPYSGIVAKTTRQGWDSITVVSC